MKTKPNKYIMLCSCFAIAAVLAVCISVSTAEKEVPHSELVRLETEEETAQVNLNKNAVPKIETAEKKEIKSEKKEIKVPAEEKQESAQLEDELIFSLPVVGSVAMDYSMEKMVYDPTLEQYRTSDSMCFVAEEGTEVNSSAQGTVESVLNDKADGVSVTVFHGDGWRTTYSQLGEDVAVSQGDIVEKGQLIGFVGQPGIMSSAMGSHLEFKMTLNGESIDPKTVVAK
ncbi:MAG: M23 family metallopeptidase [Firmicutes bacterium]|nr:M23 family metallopeptidase [Bacillota bacterium]